MASFMPFGLGPRMCVGINFAVTEAKIALSMILQRYSFTLSPGYVHSPSQFVTIRPQHGVQVILQSL
ncbi:putative 11-oxo-beta-amyrin 30-oxidase [Rosa chinensis]|uniref:Putative 11-oxo-beta-amyrin 30-oxidase n=3 Tax=Rosa chinensis TaxID=74649 RepID=A0A2P6SD78_ROSCH|nr:putative 11-oxo-beta-amyrin 30-oxidase [Rosa chinensis]